MNLNPVDWNDAQSLLVKLVQALSPLTVRTVSPSFFFNRRFVFPHSFPHEELRNRSSLRILSTLHAVQKEVDEWIAEPVSIKEEVVEITRPQQNEKPPRASPSHKREATTQKPIVQQERRSPPEDPVPLVRQAKELICQVQKAIVQLSSSNFIQAPKQEPLIQTLKQLKPKLDEIIKNVAEGKELAPIEKETSFRHALPTSPREEFIQKLKELPRVKPLPVSRETPIPFSLQEQVAKAEQERKREPLFEKPLKKQTDPKREEKEEPIDPLPTKKIKEKESAPVLFHAEKMDKGESYVKIDPKLVALPGAPIVFEPKRLSQNRKKKKRKGFWFKDESEEESSK